MTDAEKKIVEISQAVGRIEANMADVRHALFGNGQPGIVQRFNVLENSHKNCRAAHEKEAERAETVVKSRLDTRGAAVAAVVGAACSAVATLLFGWLQKIF